MDNKRAYQRGSHFNGRVRISKDGETWHHANVGDVSSGGLKLYSSVDYSEGEILWFDMVLEGFLTEIKVQTQGEVRRKSPYAGKYQYGIRFKGISPAKAVQIDENVRNDRPVSGGSYEAD